MFENIRADYALHNPRRNRAFWHLLIYRFGRWSIRLKFAPARWLLSKVYSVANIVVSNFILDIYMSRDVQVGKGFHIIHPDGVRIHNKAVIGDRVGILHGVNITQNMFPGHVPVIGNDVFIGAKATVIGKIKIGDGVRIAANTLVITNIPPGVTAIGVPAKILRVPRADHGSHRDENGLPGRRPGSSAQLDQIGSTAQTKGEDRPRRRNE
jgi:serine O-acetyltransferase